jgi:hypothetical protein
MLRYHTGSRWHVFGRTGAGRADDDADTESGGVHPGSAFKEINGLLIVVEITLSRGSGVRQDAT